MTDLVAFLSLLLLVCSFLLVVSYTDFTPKRDNGSLSCQFHKSQSSYGVCVFVFSRKSERVPPLLDTLGTNP